MTNVRPFWIAWCCGWALFWFVVGWFTLGFGWLGTALSLLAILVPVGAPARPPLPALHLHYSPPPLAAPHYSPPPLPAPRYPQLPPNETKRGHDLRGIY